MILYSTVGTSDMERAIKFYDAVFGALGISRAPHWSDGWAGWGGSYDEGYGSPSASIPRRRTGVRRQ
jgi:catechol 2,3-dioxygenase-like lactoylglutathione lyase family enzyme